MKGRNQVVVKSFFYWATNINEILRKIFRKVLKEISIGDMEPDESIESVQEANLLSKLDNPYIFRSTVKTKARVINAQIFTKAFLQTFFHVLLGVNKKKGEWY